MFYTTGQSKVFCWTRVFIYFNFSTPVPVDKQHLLYFSSNPSDLSQAAHLDVVQTRRALSEVFYHTKDTPEEKLLICESTALDLSSLL